MALNNVCDKSDFTLEQEENNSINFLYITISR
jgi:hypothetical protein